MLHLFRNVQLEKDSASLRSLPQPCENSTEDKLEAQRGGFTYPRPPGQEVAGTEQNSGPWHLPSHLGTHKPHTLLKDTFLF